MPRFAIVTGGSSGIGLEIAKLAAKDGYDLLVAAGTPLVDAANQLGGLGVEVRNVEADLSTFEGVDRLLAATGGRQVDVLVANAATASAALSWSSIRPSGGTSSIPISSARFIWCSSSPGDGGAEHASAEMHRDMAEPGTAKG